jgi:RHS repeat-associated protein
MKNLYYILFLLPVFLYGQDQNFVKTVTYRQPTTTAIPTPTPVQAAVSITFFDGLGRPIQQVAHKQSASGKNIITPIYYDALGRQPKEYLPFPSQNDNMLFTDNAIVLSGLQSYYSNAYGTDDGMIPYSEKRFEASPMNRVLEQGAPGYDWRVLPSSSSGHTIKLGYASNAVNEVKNFKAMAQTPSLIKQAFSLNLTDLGFYPENQLYKNVLTDENGVVTHEFKNQQGQVLLKRNFSDYKDIGGNIVGSNIAHDTYYIYDQYGNLTYVVPPLANGNTNTGSLDGLCYQYKYDYRNRLVEKKLPGKGWEFIVYDKLDRPVATGPANSPFESPSGTGWLFTKYDALGRSILTGWKTATVSSTTREDLQDLLNNTTILNEMKSITGDNKSDDIPFRYTNTAWPTSKYHVLTVNYYDDYNYPNPPSNFNPVESQTVHYNSSNKPKGMPTGSLVRVLTTTWSTAVELSYSLYDHKARPIRSYIANHLGGHTNIDTKMDFEGKPQYSVTSHSYDGSTVRNIVDNYTYTQQGLPQSHLQTVDTEPEELINEITYNQLGQVESKLVGGNNNTMVGFQTVDYTYNIRGWLLSINDVNDLNSTKDLFAFKLNYNTVENDLGGNITPLYNGNISETFWTTTDHTQRKYGYAYDQLNRLNDAIYQNLDSGTTNSYDELIRYDKNGNIKQLQRNGYLDSNVPYQIDDLSYRYNTLSNTLTNVIDHSNSADGFKDVPALPGNVHYEYDDYGNLKYDKKKDMVLSYNHLNLPLTIKFVGPADEGYINYTYNALGAKVRKIVLDNLTQQKTTTEYLAGGFQYKDSKLEFFPTPEGYVNVTDNQLYNYVYNYTDHLGNMRLSYTFDQDKGQLAVLQENHYYPFGMKHLNYGVSDTGYKKDEITGQLYAVIKPVATNKFKYKYNGKEYQDELNLNLYDYGARNYDPALGRWMNIDPLAETSRRYSPYTYALNNPIRFIDPDGMEATDDYKLNKNGDIKLVARTKDKTDRILKTDSEGEVKTNFDIKYNTCSSMVSDLEAH